MKNKPLISIVVPTYNDHINFQHTISSVKKFCKENYEIVIVDGGDKSNTLRVLSSTFMNYDEVSYIRDEGKGVYPAQNLGINNSKGEWIMILNSGDLLTKEAEKILTNDFLSKYDKNDILVFSQNTFSDESKIEYIFSPTKDSIWPHQSILVKRQIYKQYGVYNEDLKICSDQLFFANIRAKVSFVLIDTCLTSYELGGLSNQVSFSISKEIYIVQRALHMSILKSFFIAFLRPRIRVFLQFLFGGKLITFLKKKNYTYYSK